MHPTFAAELAAQRIAELRQQAARHPMLRQVRAVGAASPVNGRVRGSWVRFGIRRSRQAVVWLAGLAR